MQHHAEKQSKDKIIQRYTGRPEKGSRTNEILNSHHANRVVSVNIQNVIRMVQYIWASHLKHFAFKSLMFLFEPFLGTPCILYYLLTEEFQRASVPSLRRVRPAADGQPALQSVCPPGVNILTNVIVASSKQ